MDSTYYKAPETVREYIQLSKDVNGADLIDRLKSFLPPKSKLLELGSGPGSDWALLRDEYEVTGSDYSLEFIKHLKDRHPEGTFLQLDAITLTVDQSFKGIYSNKVLHHLTDQELQDSIARQYQVLEEGGIICHSFWKGQGEDFFKGLYVNNHLESELKVFFEPLFELLLLENYQEFEAEDSLVLIAKKRAS